MTATEVLEWVTERYGEPTIQHANGVFIYVVGVYGGVAIGCGSDTSSAVCDLYLDLHGHDRRGDVPPPSQVWEQERRQRRAKRLTATTRKQEGRDDG